MRILGLHWLDASIILLYCGVILWIGRFAARRTRNQGDFFLAGRRLGKFYQFFLNFGSSTNVEQAAAVSREIYRQGIGGMWIQYLVLFLTPFYWFTTAFMRRTRLITMGDLFTERFRSRFLGGAFALFTLLMAFIGGGVGYMVVGKTFAALTPKPVAFYTAGERRQVEMYEEHRRLKARLDQGLEAAEEERYQELDSRFKRGELKSQISYVNLVVVYLVFAAIVAAYTMMGGFFAAAVTDVVQGFLIIVFSVMLIPLGLAQVGGFAGLHARLPAHMFNLFGSAALSDYAWYTIAAMSLANLVSIIASAPMMQTAGSARDEMTARVGMLGGMFFKRFLMIFWALAGLLAVGLLGGAVHDPDLIWGALAGRLLFPGAIGLMLAGIMAAGMSSLGATSVSYSALFIRNLYQPFAPNKSERHYINVGRGVIAAKLFGGVATAVFFGNLLELFKYFISLPAVFGAAIWLGFLWRRLTKAAVIIQAVVCFTLYALIPNLFQSLDWARTNEAFLLETRPRTVLAVAPALAADVEAGLAERVGQEIRKSHRVEPAAVFYDQVARRDPSDPASPKVGLGRFNAEVWVLSWTGIDFRGSTKAQLQAVRFLFDALFPFILLILLSFITRGVPRADVDRFFAKLHTPIGRTLEEDAAAVEESLRRPDRFERDKLRPGSSWEFMKPRRQDLFGFGLSWLLVGVILLLLWIMVTVR
ncbi:MAG: transporter [Candidatus Aminicenantes bacterium RBG_13_63_10]|nr:MAG: transporter [Candidatus Aminicenantes bacterium RBG_13_63_10]